MPKKNSIINNTPPQEKILIEDEEPQPPQPELTKPKRQISDAQREHLNNIRSKALNGASRACLTPSSTPDRR